MSTPHDYFPLLFQLAVALGFVGVTLVATHLLGPNRKGKRKEETFECGIDVVGNARVPFSIKYFLTAILFVLFDVEIIFFYPYAVNIKNLGVAGFMAVVMFVSFFLLGFVYVWKKGALEWDK